MRSANLSGGDGDVGVLLHQLPAPQLSQGSQRPGEPLPHDARSQGHIDNNLLLGGLLGVSHLNQVSSADPSNPSGNVQEHNSRVHELSQMSLVTVHNQMGQTIGSAQQTLVTVERKPTLSLLDGRVDGERGRAVRCVQLQPAL